MVMPETKIKIQRELVHIYYTLDMKRYFEFWSLSNLENVKYECFAEGLLQALVPLRNL